MNNESLMNNNESLMNDNESLINEFLASLNDKELIAYNIAKSHLGTLFSLDKSNAYLDWLNKHNTPITYASGGGPSGSGGSSGSGGTYVSNVTK